MAVRSIGIVIGAVTIIGSEKARSFSGLFLVPHSGEVKGSLQKEIASRLRTSVAVALKQA
jgi:hypothetical protein